MRTYVALGGVTIFVLTVVALHFLQPGLSPVEEAISYYVHGSHGWLLTAGLVALGVGSLSLVAGLVDSVKGPGARIGRWSLGVWGVGVLLGGVFRADPPGQWSEPPSVAGMIHGNAALLAFLAFPVAALSLARSFRQDERWRSPGTVLLGLAVASAISLIAFMASLIPVFLRPGPPILLGLTERVLVAIYSAWLMAVATTLLKHGQGVVSGSEGAA